MSKIKHIINLSDTEKALLHKVIEEPTSSERHVKRAKILLASDFGNPERMTIERITKEYQTTGPTVMLTRQNYLMLGVVQKETSI